MLVGAFVAVFVLTALGLVAVGAMGSPYLAWDFGDPEMAVAGTMLHGFEWVFVRAAPFVLVGSAVGALLAWRRPASLR